MNILKEFINAYGAAILYTVLTAIAGYLGVWAKKLIGEFITDRRKENAVKKAISLVEQVFKDIHGEEKYEKAVEYTTKYLNEKGIKITELELRVLIESALAEFNNAFDF